MPGGQVFGSGPLYVAYNGDWYAKGSLGGASGPTGPTGPPPPLRTWDEIAGGKSWDELKTQTWDDIATNGVTP